MLIPSYSLTATERVLPRLALDFTTALLDNRVTFTRSGNTATVIDSSGVIVSVNADIPRFDYDPVALVCKGLLIEEARTNLLLNSLIDGTSLTTQSVTATAVAHTLSFYGTGNIVLSGAHSATVTGTGAYPTRTTLTFTPSAGSLTLTVTGTVQFAQLEIGGFSTSFIPTAGAAVTRNADVATMTGTNFSDWFNASEGTFAVEHIAPQGLGAVGGSYGLYASNSGGTNVIGVSQAISGTHRLCNYVEASASQATITGASLTPGQTYKFCSGYKTNNFTVAQNGAATQTDSSGTVPSNIDRLMIGSALTNQQLNSHIKTIEYWPHQLTSNEVQAFSKG